MISRRAFLLPGLSLCLPLGGCIVAGADSGWVTQRDEKRFNVEGKPEVVLATFDGAIEIQSWDRPDVMVWSKNTRPGDAAAIGSEQPGGNRDRRGETPTRPQPELVRP
jgi:hypothetical protein